jgi:hypothetical protein
MKSITLAIALVLGLGTGPAPLATMAAPAPQPVQHHPSGAALEKLHAQLRVTTAVRDFLRAQFQRMQSSRQEAGR